ncbi:MAG: hypothetical protein U9N62_03935, partial [Thermotogota bacterium]|nr:hypothetical protein [Thermotogota bacterium]
CESLGVKFPLATRLRGIMTGGYLGHYPTRSLFTLVGPPQTVPIAFGILLLVFFILVSTSLDHIITNHN